MRWQIEEVPLKLSEEIDYLECLSRDLINGYSLGEDIVHRVVILNFNRIWLKYIAVSSESPSKEQVKLKISEYLGLIDDIIGMYHMAISRIKSPES